MCVEVIDCVPSRFLSASKSAIGIITNQALPTQRNFIFKTPNSRFKRLGKYQPLGHSWPISIQRRNVRLLGESEMLSPLTVELFNREIGMLMMTFICANNDSFMIIFNYF